MAQQSVILASRWVKEGEPLRAGEVLVSSGASRTRLVVRPIFVDLPYYSLEEVDAMDAALGTERYGKPGLVQDDETLLNTIPVPA